MEKLVESMPDDAKKLIAELKDLISDGFRSVSTGYKEPGWKGYRYAMLFNSDAAKKVYEDYEFEENTVILSSFPKTGTNWMAEIISEILFGFDERLHEIVESVLPTLFVPEAWKGEKMEIWKYIPLPRKIFASHLPAPLINMEKVKKSNSKVIVPVRNPKDQAVSWYHFCQGASFDPIREYLSSEWSQFFEDYIQGKQPVPVSKPGEGYAEFLRGWNEYKDKPNILFVHFENMKRDTFNEIRRIAKFLDVDLTDYQVDTIKERTSFQTMKAKQDNKGQVARKGLNIMRKGLVGTWKDTFTVAQSEMLDEMMAKKLEGTDIKFTY